MIAVAFAYIVEYQRIVARARRRRKFQIEPGGVDFVNLDTLYLGKLLDAALHLYAFGSLVSEAFDEILRILNLLLLVLICAHLLLDALFAELHETGIIDGIVVDVAERDLDSAVGDVVDERAVVADQHHRLGFADHELFEPLYRLYVEMVGRLVEQQHVGATQKQFRQLDAHAPAAAEFRCRTAEIAAVETETHESLLHLRLHVFALLHGYQFRQRCHVVDKLVIVGRFIVGARCQFLIHSIEPRMKFVDCSERLSHFFCHCQSVRNLHLLREIAYGDILRHRHCA